MRGLLAAALFFLLPALAFAQSSPNWPLGYNPTVPEISTTFSGKQDYGGSGVLSSLTIKNPTTGATTPVLFATSYGVRADGVTSDDAAMLAAFNACALASAKLILPPGKILMNGTGSTTISIQDCSIEGQGVGPLINGDPNSIGTTVYLTSTSIVPFKVGGQWSMKGVNFYWPDQAATNGQMTVTQSTTVVTVSGISGWTLAVGDYIVPTNGKYGAMKILSFGSGSGGNGTYNVAQSQTLGSQTAYSTRITVYPALFTCGGTSGSTGCNGFRLDQVNLVNAYDGLVATSPNLTGHWWWGRSTLYALHDVFRIYEAGDYIDLHDNIYDFGDWMALTGFSTSSKVAGSAAGQQNSVLHATSLSGGASIGGSMSGSVFGFRYGVLLDNGAGIANMRFNLNFDGVGTWIDASSGGVFSGETNSFQGVGDCSLINFVGEGAGNGFCFDMGANSALVLNGTVATGPGSFLRTTGSRITMTGVTVSSIGSVADGSDYYIVNASGGAQLLIRDGAFSGRGSDAHVHGILQTAAAAYTQIANDKFSNFNDALNLTFGGGTNIITGNASDGTNGTASLVLPSIQGMVYANNRWDKPPTITISSCGTGASVSGLMSGRITVGSTNPTTQCTFTLPFGLYGALGGQCVFMWSSNTNQKIWKAFVASGPAGYTIYSDSDMHGQAIDYICSSEQ